MVTVRHSAHDRNWLSSGPLRTDLNNHFPTMPGLTALRACLLSLGIALLAGCGSLPSLSSTKQAATAPTPTPAPVAVRKPKIGLALGGGAARGFAHIGVIKMLESQGIVADYVVGTSAGAVVGSLYAGGYDAFAMQKIAVQLDEKSSPTGPWAGAACLRARRCRISSTSTSTSGRWKS